jgi:lipid-A-disaccharide synthase
VPALRRRFPDRELVGLGGVGIAGQGVRLVGRSDRISVMGYSGLLPQLPQIFRALLQTAAWVRRRPPACVIAVDIWQPLRMLHRWAPALREVPHLCYLPPAPNLVGRSRVHAAVGRVFGAVVTPFPHQERLYGEAGAAVYPGAHAGLETCREEARALPVGNREDVLALLPGSRTLEVRTGLPVQHEAARLIRERYPELTPVVCCAGEEIARQVQRDFPELRQSRRAREVMARARFALICSGTAVLEAALLGCPGVVTYSGSRLQEWEWYRLHVPRLARLRAAGIASPFIALPNIIAGEALYPEVLGTPARAVADAALTELSGDQAARREALDGVVRTLHWEDAGTVVAEQTARLLGE